MKNRHPSAVVGLIICWLLSACATPIGTPIDLMPMYGGIDRSSNPDLARADHEYIEEMVQQFGSHTAAAEYLVDYAFRLYLSDDYDRAMRRFNQTWLLDPENAEVYAGFGSVLSIRGQYCEARVQMEKSISLNAPKDKGIYTDAATMNHLCALNDTSLSAAEKSKLFSRSEELFVEAAEFEPKKDYLYSLWAVAKYEQKNYADAWQIVATQRETGGTPDPEFVKALAEKMPDPSE